MTFQEAILKAVHSHTKDINENAAEALSFKVTFVEPTEKKIGGEKFTVVGWVEFEYCDADAIVEWIVHSGDEYDSFTDPNFS